MKRKPRSLRQIVRDAERAGEKCIELATALRLEAKGLGRVFFEQGRGVWCPLSEKAQ